ncbi:hypothetical protein TNCV_1165351 [Trichonephila clavipes]|nr:hypothetical protein TNCV_1165351 [Trichonephila clavipes]
MADHSKEELENRLRRHSHSTPGSQEDVREGSLQEEFDPFLGEGDFFEENVNISLTAPPQTQPGAFNGVGMRTGLGIHKSQTVVDS